MSREAFQMLDEPHQKRTGGAAIISLNAGGAGVVRAQDGSAFNMHPPERTVDNNELYARLGELTASLRSIERKLELTDSAARHRDEATLADMREVTSRFAAIDKMLVEMSGALKVTQDCLAMLKPNLEDFLLVKARAGAALVVVGLMASIFLAGISGRIGALVHAVGAIFGDH